MDNIKGMLERLGVVLFTVSYLTVGCYWLGRLTYIILKMSSKTPEPVWSFWFLGIISSLVLIVVSAALYKIWEYIVDG